MHLQTLNSCSYLFEDKNNIFQKSNSQNQKIRKQIKLFKKKKKTPDILDKYPVLT